MTLPRRLRRTSALLGVALGNAARRLGLGPPAAAGARWILARLDPTHPALAEPPGDAEPPETASPRLAAVPDGYAQGRADLQLTHGSVRLSDGYLPDAETWQPLDGRPLPPEVLALARLDRVLGNEGALSETGVGRLRGLVLDALRDWYRRNPAPRPGPRNTPYPPRPRSDSGLDGTAATTAAEQFWTDVDAGRFAPSWRQRHPHGEDTR